MKKKLRSTRMIQEANENVTILRENIGNILQQPIWKKNIGMREKIEYIRELASAKMRLWQAIEKDYPELVGKAYSVDSINIEYEVQVDKKGKLIK